MGIEFNHRLIGFDQLGGVEPVGLGFSIHPHGTEFIAGKLATFVTDSLLSEEDRPRRAKLNPDRYGAADQQHRRGDYKNENEIE
jgi:hypothetical protein